MRLRRVSPSMRGWTRRRHGRGFVYLDHDGLRLCDDDVARCRELVIPPAWQDVWICPLPQGHLQAVGTDDAGRRQYLYHPAWRVQRDDEKFDHMLDVAARLPAARRRARADLDAPDRGLRWAQATAFMLLDLGLFRIGSAHYLEENGSYGLSTLEKRHAHRHQGAITFTYVAKSGQHREITVASAPACAALDVMLARRGGSDRLLAYKTKGRWTDLTADDVTTYLKELVGDEMSAKDFRTWHGTVVAAVSLARSGATTATARARAERAAFADVAEHLGNTPAVARSSYVDPRIVTLFEQGVTVSAHHRLVAPGTSISHRLEADVLDLIRSSST